MFTKDFDIGVFESEQYVEPPTFTLRTFNLIWRSLDVI